MFEELENLSANGANVTLNLRNGVATVTIKKRGVSVTARARGITLAVERALRAMTSRKTEIQSARRVKDRERDEIDRNLDDPRHAW
jgi:hypothetical protein